MADQLPDGQTESVFLTMSVNDAVKPAQITVKIDITVNDNAAPIIFFTSVPSPKRTN